jgi:hypothetical protein
MFGTIAKTQTLKGNDNLSYAFGSAGACVNARVCVNCGFTCARLVWLHRTAVAAEKMETHYDDKFTSNFSGPGFVNNYAAGRTKQ